MALTVLHVAPHPDDEALGAPATLLGLRRAGHRVVNLTCSLGRPEQHTRRRAEVEEACRRLGFELVVHDRPGDEAALGGTVRAFGADLVIGPSAYDGHPSHESVGRALRDGLASDGAPPLWTWGLWASLRAPTLYVPYDEAVLEAALHGLRAHAGELARNDYEELLRARGVVGRVQGAEQVFGFGTGARPGPYAEVLEEALWVDGAWWPGVAREPDLARPV